MQELISPQQSELLVWLIAGVLAVIGAVFGGKVLGARGIFIGLCGPLVLGLWKFHQWLTRYDLQTGYFGLDKVSVLLMEAVIFVALGAVLGVLWDRISKPRMNANERE